MLSFNVALSMDKMRVARFIRIWVTGTIYLFYFFLIAVLSICVHPAIAGTVLFFTFGAVYLLSLKLYDAIAEIL
jgi:hypothetical protein